MVSPIVEEYRKKNSNLFTNFVNNLSTGKIFTIVIIILILLAIGKNGDTRFTYSIMGILIFMIIYLLVKPSKEKMLLDIETAGAVAQDYLERMRLEGRKISFDSKVEILPCGQSCYRSDTLTGESAVTHIDIGYVEYVNGTNYKKEGVIKIHPYDGTIMGMLILPLGYSGRELTTNVKLVPVGVMNINSNQDYKPSD